MKKPVLWAVTLTTSLTAILMLPQIASAQCATYAGSASISCQQGVTIIRQNQAPLPSINPTTQAQLQLQRQKLAQQREAMRQRAMIAQQQQRLEAERVRNQGYLYRDANSPLRQRSQPQGYGTRGYRTNNTVVVTGR